MPAGIQRRADVAAIMAELTGDAGFSKQVEQGIERTRMAEQVAIFRGLRHTVMDTRQTTGDGAHHSPRMQRPHKVLEEDMELMVSHRMFLLFRNRLVQIQ